MNNLNRSAVIGLIFLGIGSVLILRNLQLIPWNISNYIFQWENILILVGAVLAITKQNVRVGFLLIGLGIFFSLDHLFHIRVDVFDLWPAVFIVAGYYIITRNKGGNTFEPGDQALNSDMVEDIAIFGGGDRVITSHNFQGGTLTAIFGGSNIDLTSSQLADGDNVIDVFYMFGGSKIRVPQDWNVQVNVVGIFGGMSDKRALIDADKYSTKTLYIKGLTIFGGAEITN